MARELINLADRQTKLKLIQRIGTLSGPYWLELVKFRKGRSLRANAYYWAVRVQQLAEFLREQGEPYTNEQAHEILKGKWLRVSVADPRTGEVIGERVRSTADLNTAEFAQYVDNCVSWLAEMFGIICPDPNDFVASVSSKGEAVA